MCYFAYATSQMIAAKRSLTEKEKKKEKGSRMLTREQDNNAKAEHCNRRVTITIQQLPIVTRVASNNRGNNICGRFAFFPPGLHYSCYVSRAFLSRGLSSVLDTIDAGISETTYCSVQQKASEYVHRNTKAGLPRFAPRPLLTKPHNVRRIWCRLLFNMLFFSIRAARRAGIANMDMSMRSRVIRF